MPGFAAFDRELTLATAGIAPENLAKELARFARAEVAKAVAAGAPAEYDRYVNGRLNAPEESVTPPGPIVYVFSNWSLVINAAIAELVKRSPKKSGRYVSSFVVVANGAVVTDYSKIPAAAECIIFNAQPYTRKLETSDNGWQFRQAKGTLSRRFGSVFKVETTYLSIKSGLHRLVPYHLKRTTPRRKAGEAITYPALVINVL